MAHRNAPEWQMRFDLSKCCFCLGESVKYILRSYSNAYLRARSKPSMPQLVIQPTQCWAQRQPSRASAGPVQPYASQQIHLNSDEQSSIGFRAACWMQIDICISSKVPEPVCRWRHPCRTAELCWRL